MALGAEAGVRPRDGGGIGRSLGREAAVVDLIRSHRDATSRRRPGFTAPAFRMTGPRLGVTDPLTMDEIERQSEGRGWDTAKTLAEALPYIQIYVRETVVIKYGGHAMGERAMAKQFAAGVALL